MGLCRNTGPGNRFPWTIDLVGEKKIYVMLNAYMAVISCNYYFHIPHHTLGSLGAVLISFPKLLYATVFKRVSITCGRFRRRLPAHRGRSSSSSSSLALHLCPPPAPKPHLEQTSRLPHTFSILPQCDLGVLALLLWWHLAGEQCLKWKETSGTVLLFKMKKPP